MVNEFGVPGHNLGYDVGEVDEKLDEYSVGQQAEKEKAATNTDLTWDWPMLQRRKSNQYCWYSKDT